MKEKDIILRFLKQQISAEVENKYGLIEDTNNPNLFERGRGRMLTDLCMIARGQKPYPWTKLLKEEFGDKLV